MRVNHTGEVCAQALYQGQALTARLEAVRDRMEQASGEENDHLAWCETRLKGGHPSVLNSIILRRCLYHRALAGKAGDRWSLGFRRRDRAAGGPTFECASGAPADRGSAQPGHSGADAGRRGPPRRRCPGGWRRPLAAARARLLMRGMSKVMTQTTYWFWARREESR